MSVTRGIAIDEKHKVYIESQWLGIMHDSGEFFLSLSLAGGEEQFLWFVRKSIREE